MSKDISFKVFRSDEDHLKWNKLIEFVAHEDGFSNEEKLAIQQAFNEMSKILGRNFLIEGKKFNHFLSQHFLNKAPWAMKWAIWFAEALHHLVKNDVSGEILSKLKSKQHHEEGLTFLEINFYFSKVGFNIQFEQEIIINSNSKFPDLRLTNPLSNQVIFLELTTLHISDEHDWNKSKFNKLALWIQKDLLRHQIGYCGKVSNLNDSNYDSIAYEILLMKKEIILNKGFHFIESENLKLGMAHPDHSNELANWAEKEKIGINSLTGDEITLDGDIERLKNKIKSKTSQLSDKYSNVIAISMHQLFMMAGDKLRMFGEIGSYITRYPHIFGVLVYGRNPLSNNGDSYAEIEGHLFSTRTIAELHTTSFFFIRNLESRDLHESNKEMFYQAFRFGKNVSNV